MPGFARLYFPRENARRRDGEYSCAIQGYLESLKKHGKPIQATA